MSLDYIAQSGPSGSPTYRSQLSPRERAGNAMIIGYRMAQQLLDRFDPFPWATPPSDVYRSKASREK